MTNQLGWNRKTLTAFLSVSIPLNEFINYVLKWDLIIGKWFRVLVLSGRTRGVGIRCLCRARAPHLWHVYLWLLCLLFRHCRSTLNSSRSSHLQFTLQQNWMITAKRARRETRNKTRTRRKKTRSRAAGEGKEKLWFFETNCERHDVVNLLRFYERRTVLFSARFVRCFLFYFKE